MDALRTTFVATFNCPSDPNGFTASFPESGPGGDTGLPIPLCMPANYRCVAGADTGSDPNGGDENWDDALEVVWLIKNIPYDRGVMHATGVNSGAKQERIANITDGTSNTLMLGEYATKTHLSRRTFWAYSYTSYNESVVTIGQSRTLLPDFDRCTNTPPKGSNQCKRAWGSFHPGGLMNFAFCDGSVRTVSQNIDMTNVMPALATIAGDEVATADDL
jgi:prepilin-type processing-associated H-X9-DG protein